MVAKPTHLSRKSCLPLYILCAEFFFFFGMEEFYSYKEKTLQKRQSRETKYNTTKKKNI